MVPSLSYGFGSLGKRLLEGSVARLATGTIVTTGIDICLPYTIGERIRVNNKNL